MSRNQIVNTDAGQSFATVSWSGESASDNVAVTSFTSDIAKNSQFNVGSTVVTYTAEDAASNRKSCAFNVIVSDGEAPQLSCPSDINFNAASGINQAIATWTVTSDNVDSNLLPSGDHTSGDSFGVGSTPVTYTVTDAAGLSDSCTFNVIVSDNEAPQLSGCPPSSVVLILLLKHTIVYNFAISASDNVDGAVTVNVDHAGNTFALGSTTVTASASDSANNAASCSFTVVVTDTENPKYSNCPSDITVSSTSGNVAVATWSAPVASDNVGVESDIGSASSGDAFGIGRPTVTYTVRDTAGLTGTCSFNVIVGDGEAPVYFMSYYRGI